MGTGSKMGTSHIGSKKEVLEMLDLVAEKGIKPWCGYSFISGGTLTDGVCSCSRIEEAPMKECGRVVEAVYKNKVRYRYVLTQDLA